MTTAASEKPIPPGAPRVRPGSALSQFCGRIVRATLDFVYPPACLLCADEILSVSQGFCRACRLKMVPQKTQACPRCGAPVGPYVDVSDGCALCRKETFSFDGVIRLGLYDGELRSACLRAKANGGSVMSRGLACLLIDAQRERFQALAADLVLPIPEHWTRRFQQTHYAAETISRELSRQLRLPWQQRTLFKRHRTPKQATSPRAQRRAQQAGSFSVASSLTLNGRTILLVDDILTTGATATAAAKALKTAGAKCVVVAVIAVSPMAK